MRRKNHKTSQFEVFSAILLIYLDAGKTHDDRKRAYE